MVFRLGLSRPNRPLIEGAWSQHIDSLGMTVSWANAPNTQQHHMAQQWSKTFGKHDGHRAVDAITLKAERCCWFRYGLKGPVRTRFVSGNDVTGCGNALFFCIRARLHIPTRIPLWQSEMTD